MGLQVETRQSFKDGQAQVTELDGKIVGMQTEMRQRFDMQDACFETQDRKSDQILLLLNTLTNKPGQNI